MKVTVKQFCQKRPYLTEPGMRWMLFNRVQNGLNVAVTKIGKKVLIDEDAYDKWEDQHREVSA
jgi:hypothetical protein